MSPLPFVWPIAVLFWAAFLWTAAGELPLALRANASTTAPTDRGSKRLVELSTAVGAALAFAAAARLRRFEIASARVPVYLAGVGLLAAGGALRRHCFRMLGASFTFDVRVAPDQEVVQRGAYRYVRHPSYSAGVLAFIGIGLALGNWLSLAVVTLLPGMAYVYRIAVEERALVAALGSEYRSYMTRTTRLLPFVI